MSVRASERPRGRDSDDAMDDIRALVETHAHAVQAVVLSVRSPEPRRTKSSSSLRRRCADGCWRRTVVHRHDPPVIGMSSSVQVRTRILDAGDDRPLPNLSVSGRVTLPGLGYYQVDGQTDEAGRLLIQGLPRGGSLRIGIESLDHVPEDVQVSLDGCQDDLVIREVRLLEPRHAVAEARALAGYSIDDDGRVTKTPAQVEDVAVGDHVVEIDGRATALLRRGAMLHLLEGDPGTMVKVVVEDPAGRRRSVSASRR